MLIGKGDRDPQSEPEPASPGDVAAPAGGAVIAGEPVPEPDAPRSDDRVVEDLPDDGLADDELPDDELPDDGLPDDELPDDGLGDDRHVGDGGAADGGLAGDEPGRRPGMVNRRRLLAAIAVAVVVVVGAAFGIVALVGGTHAGGSSRPVPAGFVTYHDTVGGFSISYPRTWQRLSANGASTLLVNAGGNDAMTVRVIQLQSAIDGANVSAVKQVTDAILASAGANLTVLGSRAITLHGLAGYYYLYTFSSTPPGQAAQAAQTGVHAHYFFFQGRKLTILVFQALPVTDFQRLAGVFDQVSGSLQTDPKILGPAPTVPPATAPPATTVPAGSAPATTSPSPAPTPATTAPG